MKPRLLPPSTGPVWLPPYTRSIERRVDGVRSEATGFAGGSRSVTASGAVSPDDMVLLVDCTGGAVTVTLPLAAENVGRVLWAKKVDVSANAMTVDGSGSETIDGAASVSTAVSMTSWTLFCDGSGWWVI